MYTKLIPDTQGLRESLGKDVSLSSASRFATIDDIFSRLGFGPYHIKCYVVLGLILMNDGAESLVLSILQNILKTEWHLTESQNSWIGTAVFIGFLIGSLVSGKVSDKYGRRKPLIFLALALYIVALASAFAQNYGELIATRAMYGFLVGIQFPMCFTYLTEITPKEIRGRALVLAGGFFTLGELLTCGVSFFTLNGISSGNWRLLLICVAQPALLCWIGTIFWLYESPRYLISNKHDIKQAVDVLNKIASQRDAGLVLGEEEVETLDKWVNSRKNLKKRDVGSVLALFRDQTKVITACLWPVWFVLSLSYYGMVYILPQTVSAMDKNSDNDDSNDLWSITYPALGELPSVVLAVLIVEFNMFGRRRSMIGGFAITTLLCVLAGLAPAFNVWVTGARTILNGTFIIASPYTAELYQTTVRTTGLGMASACSRVGGALMPWITTGLFKVGPRIPFLGFAIFCVVGAVCCLIIPYDTTNKELDFEYSSKSKKITVTPQDHTEKYWGSKQPSSTVERV